MQVAGRKGQLGFVLAVRIVEKIVSDRALMGCGREYLADNTGWRKLQIVYPCIKREQFTGQAFKASDIHRVLLQHGGHRISDRQGAIYQLLYQSAMCGSSFGQSLLTLGCPNPVKRDDDGDPDTQAQKAHQAR